MSHSAKQNYITGFERLFWEINFLKHIPVTSMFLCYLLGTIE